MKIDINYIPEDQTELAKLYVKKEHEALDELVQILEKESYRTKALTVYDGKDQYKISCAHIFYIESCNDKTLVHTGNYSFQSKSRLYELEAELPDYFFRVSKSVILNLRKVQYYRPELSGIMKAVLKNNAAVYISRKYLKELRLKIGR